MAGTPGEYGGAVSPETTLGMLVQANAGVKIGTMSTFGSLETTSLTYTSYSASIGLLSAESFNVGEVSSLGATINATAEPFESVNVRPSPSLFPTIGFPDLTHSLNCISVSLPIFTSLNV